MSDRHRPGGVARAKALSPERRSEIARMGAAARNGAPTADALKRAARKKADRAMARMAKQITIFGREMEAAGASLEELAAAAGRLSELLHAQGGQKELPHQHDHHDTDDRQPGDER